MFFISLGSKWEYKKEANGLLVDKLCPECERHGEFFEVIPTKYFTVFWIPVSPVEKKKPLLECPNCNERFYIQTSDYSSAKIIPDVIKTPPPAKKSPKPPEKEIHFIFECEECSQKLRVPQKNEIISVHCPNCNNSFKVKKGKRI
jgi:Zn finger protein HypA/HybF involved in hydrogenase expression